VSLRPLLNAPLLHFVLLGALVFGVHLARGGSMTVDRPGVIVVDDAVRARLIADHERIEGSLPSGAELGVAEDTWVRDQVLRREARALGLDRGDLVVERRLAQKMRFLLRSEADPQAPTEADLQTVLDGSPETFRTPGRYRLEQRVFKPTRPDARGAAEAALTSDDPGDPFIHGTVLDGSAQAIDERLGAGFAAQLDHLPMSRWAGPLEGRQGLHIVRLEARAPPSLGTVDSHRGSLTETWREARRDALQRERVRDLVGRYTVRRSP
jgi:hypothetical protein